MRAIVKETGDIIEVEKIGISSNAWALQSDSTVVFNDEELDINIEPDYWEKLKHQYAGKFLQGMIIGKPFTRDYVEYAYNYAAALVNKLKEESRC